MGLALGLLGGHIGWRPQHLAVHRHRDLASLSLDELIRRFDAPMFQGMPDYYVGLRCLAAGELERARSHFQNCCDSGRFLAPWYWWSKAFLARIDTPESKVQE